jgi:hypothetical protein
MVWRVLLVLLAVIVLTSCVTCADKIKEGVEMTMGACYAKCDMLPVGERPDCIKGCCTAICDGAPRTTQGCKHYCGIETRQRNTPRRILPHVSTHPDAAGPAEASHLASHHTTPPPLAHQRNTNWPVLYGPHGKENKSWYLPPNSKLQVPSVKELLRWN